MKQKNIIILRGISGCGKSTFADLLCSDRRGWVSVEADRFFIKQDDSYHFDASLLGRAHIQCQENFKKFLTEPTVETIVVSNTNTGPSDWKFYEDEAKKGNHKVTFLILENRHGNKDVHGVPDTAKDKQRNKILSNLSL